MTTATSKITPQLTADRRSLLDALQRAQTVAPKRFPKPILTGILLRAEEGRLHISATDGEITFNTRVPADGNLPACVVSCVELVRRIKASRQPSCTLSLRSRSQQLQVNGGRVTHALPTMSLGDFPVVQTECAGETITVAADVAAKALAVSSRAVARETSRYAINGVQLESDDDGVRLAATDGRRLVIAGLQCETTTYRGQVIIPVRFAHLVQRWSSKLDAPLAITITTSSTDEGTRLPAEVTIAGPDWLLHTRELDGHFPRYREFVPSSGSRFAVDRQSLIETLKQVTLATSSESRMVRVDLSPRRIQLSASSPDMGKAHARLTARFLGGGDSTIRSAFNPGYLLDALAVLPGEQVVIDLHQNGCGRDNTVYGKPALLYALGDESVRWIVMPLNAGLEATRENLGSNYREQAA